MGIISELRLKDNYTSTVESAEKALKSFGSAIDKTSSKSSKLTTSLSGIKSSLTSLSKQTTQIKIKDVKVNETKKKLQKLQSELKKLPNKAFNVRINYKESNKDRLTRLKNLGKEKIINLKTNTVGLITAIASSVKLQRELKKTTGKKYKIDITMPNGKSIMENLKGIGKGVANAGASGGKKLLGAAATGGKMLLGAGVALAGAGAVGGAKLFQQGSKLEDYEVSMTHFLGGDEAKSKAYMEELRKNAAKTPFSTEEVIAGGTRAIQISRGDTEKGIELLKLSEDMAALTPGKTVSDAMEALADAEMGEMERLKEFGFKGSKEALDKAGGDIFSMKDGDKSLGDLFGGGTAKFEETAGGKWATITGNIEDGFMQAGRSLTEKFKPMLGKLVPISDKIAENLPKAVDFLAEKLTPLGETVSEIIDAVKGAVEPIIPTLKELGNSLFPLFGAGLKLVGSFISNFVAPAFQMLGSFIQTFVIPAFNRISNFITDFVVPAFDVVGSFLTSTVVPAFEKVSSFVGETVFNAFDKVAGVVETVKNALSGLATKIKNFVFPGPDEGEAMQRTEELYNAGLSNASGSSFFEGGVTKINEMGGEAWQLPRGTKIYPSGKTTQMISNDLRKSNNTNNNSKVANLNTTINVYESKDSKCTADEVEKRLRRLAEVV